MYLHTFSTIIMVSNGTPFIHNAKTESGKFSIAVALLHKLLWVGFPELLHLVLSLAAFSSQCGFALKTNKPSDVYTLHLANCLPQSPNVPQAIRTMMSQEVPYTQCMCVCASLAVAMPGGTPSSPTKPILTGATPYPMATRRGSLQLVQGVTVH